jgi:hypothetical protein
MVLMLLGNLTGGKHARNGILYGRSFQKKKNIGNSIDFFCIFALQTFKQCRSSV